jgi:trypsin
MIVQQEIYPPLRLHWVVIAFGFTTIAVTLVGSLGQHRPSFHSTPNNWFSVVNFHRWSKDSIGTERELRHRKKSAKKLGRIVNGDPTGAGKYPFMVALYATETPNLPDDLPVCGASLITPSIALTAAHCIMKIKSAEFGRYDINDNEGVQFFDNLLRRYHPLYDATTFNYDYALVKFTTDVKNPYLVQLWQTPEIPNEMTVMGWGVTDFESSTQPDTLLEADVSRFDTTQCAKNYAPEKITGNMFCASNSDEGRDACQGDSGTFMKSDLFYDSLVYCKHRAYRIPHSRRTHYNQWA